MIGHFERITGLLAVLALAALLVWVALSEETRIAQASAIHKAAQIETGAAIYAENCRACHGYNGEGVGALGPPLNDKAFFTTRLEDVGWTGTLQEYAIATIRQGRILATRPYYVGNSKFVMPPWAQQYGGALRDDEIRAVAAFVLNWETGALGKFQPQEVKLPTPVPASFDATTRGKELFASVGCAKCHTVNASGGTEQAPDLSHIASAAGQRRAGLDGAEYLRESILIPNAYYTEGFTNPGCGGVMSEPQLDALIGYLMTLQ